MDLFGDLPEPVSKNDYVLDTASDVNDNNSLKRKCVEDENVDSPVPKKSMYETQISSDIGDTCESVYKLRSCVVARKGERDEMQDAHTVIDDFMTYLRQFSDEVTRVAFYGVYDGHAGLKASQFASKKLHLNMAERFPKGPLSQIEKDIKRVFFDVYKKTDDEFLKDAAKVRPHWKDGSTAVTVLVVNNTLYVANIGDSKVVLARESTDGKSYLTALCLSKDHNPVDYEERQRIQRAGGAVRDGRVGGILEVSRSFGDYQFKKQGVSCIPDVRKCSLTPRDKFLIVACDGLWKSFTPEEAVSLVSEMLSNGGNSPTSHANTNQSRQVVLHSVCTKLANEAVLKLSGDNVTVMIVDIEY